MSLSFGWWYSRSSHWFEDRVLSCVDELLELIRGTLEDSCESLFSALLSPQQEID